MSDKHRAAVDAVLEAAGITVAAEYVKPGMRTGAADGWQGRRFLEWRVSFTSADGYRAVFPYRAGEGHCPAYKLPVAVAGNRNSIMRDAMVQQEVDTGRTYRVFGENVGSCTGGKPILPEVASVVSCLLSDAQAGYNLFEDFCADFGYDTDSRSAYSTFEACRDTAAKLRRVFGSAVIAQLEEALEDY